MRRFTDEHTFFIADTHFFHQNIICYENRPFDSVDEMNEQLIKNWNKKVTNNDRIFLVGDFAFGNKNKQREIARRLSGYKILIAGNHDNYGIQHYQDIGFAEVCRYPIVLNGFWLVSHLPMYIDENIPYVNIFGHVHGSPEYADFSPQSICVSVERKHMNYSPISLEEIKKILGIDL